jgi:hypothetical protein
VGSIYTAASGTSSAVSNITSESIQVNWQGYYGGTFGNVSVTRASSIPIVADTSSNYSSNPTPQTLTTGFVVDKGLIPGTSYTYTITLYNGNGITITLLTQTGTTLFAVISIYYFTRGLNFSHYTNYFSDTVTFFDALTPAGSGTTFNMTNLSTSSAATKSVNTGTNFSLQWLGYFYTRTFSGLFTFTTNSDDASILWIGSPAISGYSTTNTVVNNLGIHSLTAVSGTIALDSDTFYPIRIQYGQSTSTCDLQVSFTVPNGNASYDGSGYYFSFPLNYDSNCVMYYKFDSGDYSGSSLYNYATANYYTLAGTLDATVTASSGTALVNNYDPDNYKFGTGSLVSTAYARAKTFTPISSGMSFSFWLKGSGSPDYSSIFSFGNMSADNINFSLYTNTMYPHIVPSYTAMVEMGAYNMGPWGVTSGDPAAKQIWVTSNGYQDYPASTTPQFYTQKVFYSATAYTGTLYVMIDNRGYVHFNGTNVAGVNTSMGGGWASQVTYSVNVVVGYNCIAIATWNEGGPAGLCVSLSNSGAWVAGASTNSSWVYVYTSSSITPNNRFPYLWGIQGTTGINATNINDGSWNHIVWNIASTGVWTIYLNNTSAYTTSSFGYPSLSARSNNYIGKSNYTAADIANKYTGHIEDFRFFNRVLTVAEVQSLYYYKDTYNDLNLYYTFKTTDASLNSVLLAKVGSNALFVGGASISTTTPLKPGGSHLSLISANSQYVTIPTVITGKNGLSFSFWFRADSTADYSRIFNFSTTSRNDSIFFLILSGKIGISTYNGATYYDQFNLGSTTVNDNVWRHIVWTMTYAPTGSNTSNMVIYMNGASYTTLTSYYPNSVARKINSFGNNDWSNPLFNGAIADFRMYQRVLTAAESTSIYNFSGNVISTTIYTYTGADQTINAPSNATRMFVQAWGAGGGSRGTGLISTISYSGGGGGYTSAYFTIANSQSIVVIVGGGGATATSNGGGTAGSYGGGGGVTGNGDANWRSASGGGRSAVRLSGGTDDIITAGGGGAGGTTGSGWVGGKVGGSGGGTTGGAGVQDSGTNAGGGTQSAGGVAGNSDPGLLGSGAGSKYQGGTGAAISYASGGGGGYYGGGATTMGAAGGGSGYVLNTALTFISSVSSNGSGSTVANPNALPSGYTSSTIGSGGDGLGSAGASITGNTGKNGLVVITYYTS